MTPETYPPVASLLRSTLQIINYYSDNAYRADLAGLTSELQRTIAAIETRETMRKASGIPPGFTSMH